MSNLEAHAEFELRKAGLFDTDSSYGGMLGPAVLAMVKQFADEGHSGYSARLAVSIFEKVAMFEPLSPLTGEDDEWFEIGTGEDGKPQFQNRRCSHVFKDGDYAYDINGRVFRDPDGTTWTNGDSRVPVTFPYTPKTEIVERSHEHRP